MQKAKDRKTTASVSESEQLSKTLRDVLVRRGDTDKVVAHALADITNEGELRHLYLVLTEKTLYLMVSAYSDEMLFAGAGKPKRNLFVEDIAEVHAFSLTDIRRPQILNQVVGGLFVITVDGEERWLCRFSSARMREMSRLLRELSDLLGEEEEPTGEKPPHVPHPGRKRRSAREDEPVCCPKCGMPYPEVGRQVCPKCMEKHTVFMRVLKYFTAYKKQLIVLFSCILLSGFFNALWPYITGTLLYDKVLGKDTAFAASLGFGGNLVLMLGALVLCMVAVKLLQQITGVIHGRMTAHIVPGVVSELKNTVFGSLQRLSISFFNRRQTGSLMQRINGDANEVTGFFIDGLPYLLFNVVTLVLSTAIMFTVDWRLAIIAIILLPPLFFVSYFMLPRLWQVHGRRARVMRSLYSVLNDNFTGARVVKAFGREQNEGTRFDKVNTRVRDAEINVVNYRNTYSVAYSIGMELPVLLVWTFGAVFILQSGGAFSYGKLVTFLNYMGMLQGPLEFFSSVFQWWTNSMNAAQRVFEIIDSEPEVVERKNALQVELKGDVQLSNVTFGYEPNKQVLENIDLEVKAGEMLGIVGRSGAGKSTLVNLISRLYDPNEGEVLLDGIDVKDIAFSSLRGAIAMVSQETYIFMGTVAENIAYAKPDATREEIVRAAMAASAHGFICRLPDGYDTVIGTGGRSLSGGERQRISIARAVLADPRILVLDEATASVDTETERAIQDALDQLVKGRTTISIAHRLSTLRNADRLVVLENGKVVEHGTHGELVRNKGTYYKLLQLQSKALAMRGIGDE